ncbi:Putative Rho GTPase activation protein [Septoria linicola]|uniref:Rho GTPase activation protein n=1 Tax=Septoria linicola TaxID=215465 RepID=A0A9Q9AY06_9PEZI|nr:Putative Rho GTPase activation protein [Septoria linicola]
MASTSTGSSIAGARGPTADSSYNANANASSAGRPATNGLLSSPVSPANPRGQEQPPPSYSTSHTTAVRRPNPAKKVIRENDELAEAITREATQTPSQQQQQTNVPAASPKLAAAPYSSPPGSPTIMSNPKPAATRPIPADRMPGMAHRTASIDSTVSSVSSMSNPRTNNPGTTNAFRVSQESQGPQDVAALIAAAGSAEAALQKVLQEKQQAASHNAQLWRLVEKQRAMILGLNKDLEKSLKEKERYRRKLKDHLSQSSSAPALINTGASTLQTSSRETSQSPSQPAPPHVAARDMSVDTLKTSDTSGSAPSSVGRSDTPQDAAAAAQTSNSPTAAQRATNHDTRPVTIDTRGAALATVQRAPAGSPTTMSPRLVEIAHSPKNSISHSKNPSASLYHTSPPPSATGNFSPKTRKAPPAPLRLDPPTLRPDPNVINNVVDASDSESEYEDNPESARSEFADRGRRKTREDDDREREVLAQKEAEQRSRSKKEKKSKSRPAEATVATQPAAAESVVEEAARLNGPWSDPNPYEVSRNRAISDAANATQTRTLAAPSAMLSPGLPMSPRPGDRPPNSPMPRAPFSQAANSMPLSPRAGVAGLPLSPRAPRSAIPLPPQTPMALMSPHLDRAKGYAAQAQQPQSVASLADRLKASNDGSPDQERPSMSSDQSSLHTPGEVYRGLQTEQYPDLLLPPNALPSIYVKIASSRMIRSRASMMLPKNADENPVFTLAVHERSQNLELWRVEKTHQALAVLDHEVRTICRLIDRIPDKALFTGHAPAKIDARRMALNAYFERMLDSITEEKAARVVCKFLSTDAFGGESGDYFSTTVQDKRPESPAMVQQRLRPNMAGYLTKRGKNFGGWKARYFVLDGPLFKYYEGPGGAHLGSIKLQNAQIGKQSVNPHQNTHDDEDNQFRHAFLILEPKKKDSSALVRHVLCAESDDERDQWVDALLHYVDYREEDERLQPGRQAQVAKTDVSAPRSPRVQKSGGELRTGPSGLQETQAQAQAKLDLQAVGYNDTVAGSAPVMGPTTTRAGSDTPSPPHDKLTSGADQPHPTISAPTNLQVIQDAGNWGMKAPPTPGKDKKRSVFQLPFTRGRASSDQDAKDGGGDHAYPTARAVFGVPLAEAVEFSQPAGIDTDLPSVVYRCIEYLTARQAISEEGIFRLSGSNILIKALRERFNNEGDVNLLEEEEYYDVHAVASLLKLYLRELPASILTRDLHLDFLHCLEMPAEEKIAAVNMLVNRLPRENRALLEALSAFMLLIVNNVLVNKMNVRNLGVVFSPTLNLPGPLISLFVEEQHSIFSMPAELEAPNRPALSHAVQAPPPGDLRSPRRQMFQDLPTPAYNQTHFATGNGPHTDDTGMIPIQPTYAAYPYQMAPQGDGGYGSLNDALRSPTVYSTTATGAPTPREVKQRRRESTMLAVNNGPAKKPSQSRLREEHGTSF